MKKLSQKGFTLIEALLIIIAVSLVFGIGYYVYEANKQADATLKTSESDPKSKSDTKKKDYLAISELGIKFDKSAIPGAYYKISESEQQRAYPNVPELTWVHLYDSTYDNTKNSKGETCESLGSEIVVLEVISIADRDKNYGEYKAAELGPNDEVPAVVSDKYAEKTGDQLYYSFKAQGVQAPLACMTLDDGDELDNEIQDKFDSSYKKLQQAITTLEKA